MSLPYQRGSDKESRSSGYFSGVSTPHSDDYPIWKTSSKKRVDTKRLGQLVGGIAGIIIFITLLSSLFGHRKQQTEFLSSTGHMNTNRFVDFEGGIDCRVSSTDLYVPPVHDTAAARRAFPFCKNRQSLLEALNSGGRHGFDEPFTPKGCHYKWYSTKEICMILDRFDGIVFVGDDLMHQIYAAFNILLRQDLSLGALETWKMSEKQRQSCRCGRQYTSAECSKFFISSSQDVFEHDPKSDYNAPAFCNRIPHFYMKIKGSPAAASEKERFKNLLDQDPHSWKPVPIVHSLGLSTGFDWSQATNSMDEWLTIADNSGRNTPFLWVGPNAAGHLKPPTKIMQEGNNALWHYTVELGKEAGRRGVESLGMYNNTLQASSWDGSSYDHKVALVQAMEASPESTLTRQRSITAANNMDQQIINWFARLETT